MRGYQCEDCDVRNGVCNDELVILILGSAAAEGDTSLHRGLHRLSCASSMARADILNIPRMSHSGLQVCISIPPAASEHYTLKQL